MQGHPPGSQHFEVYGPVPGVVPSLPEQRPALVGEGAADVEVYEDSPEGLTVDVSAQRREKAAEVARAAGASVPGLAMMGAVRFERIYVEEEVPGQIDAGEHSVVERALHHVGVLCITAKEIHPPVPEGHPDGGAGLAVSLRIRQVVISREGLPYPGGADSAGDIHVAQDDILPEGIQGRAVAGFRAQGLHVGHRAV